MKQYFANARRQYGPKDGVISATSSRLGRYAIDGSLKHQQKECDNFFIDHVFYRD